MIDYRGFNLIGSSGAWEAVSSDVCGSGRTKNKAVDDALRQRRGEAAESRRMDREEGVTRDK